MNVRRRLSLFLALIATALLCVEWAGQKPAAAHPIAQGRMDVLIYPTHVRVAAQIALEEVCISNMLFANAAAYKLTDEHIAKHGEYMLQHVFVYADGKPLTGRVVHKDLPQQSRRELGPEEIQKEVAIYEFEFALAKDAPPPATILLKQNVLNEVMFTPGNAWQATYVMVIGQVERQATEGLLLTSTQPIVFPCDWTPAPATTVTPDGKAAAPLAPKTDGGATFKTFMTHGIHHILEGYDHLLFVTALVLAAVSFWDLVKVVSAFTVAHSLTLGLSVFNIVRLDSSIVEPMIAASIVFVALQNAFFPKRSRGWIRLGAAFFFGLFHGLGFAGGCLDAMEGMQSSTVLLAILAFSIGVEIGHQLVVLPTFGVLTLLRRAQKDEAGVEKFNGATLKYGSIVISAAGVFYLVSALGWFHFGSEEKPEGKKAGLVDVVERAHAG